MFCTKCGVELREQDRFCPQCGVMTGAGAASAAAPPRDPLSRPMRDKKIAGVCAGFARYLGADVTLIRLLWLVVAIFTGVGFIAYLVAWIVMPRDESGLPVRQAHSGVPERA